MKFPYQWLPNCLPPFESNANLGCVALGSTLRRLPQTLDLWTAEAFHSSPPTGGEAIAMFLYLRERTHSAELVERFRNAPFHAAQVNHLMPAAVPHLSHQTK